MKQTEHIFSDNREAQAFICGVNWVNDDEVEVQDTLVHGDFVTVVTIDHSDDDERSSVDVLDHRDHV